MPGGPNGLRLNGLVKGIHSGQFNCSSTHNLGKNPEEVNVFFIFLDFYNFSFVTDIDLSIVVFVL